MDQNARAAGRELGHIMIDVLREHSTPGVTGDMVANRVKEGLNSFTQGHQAFVTGLIRGLQEG